MKQPADEPKIGDIYTPTGIYAQSHRQRRKGLIHMSASQAPEEMVFERCRSIHTFGMKCDLRVFFLGSDNLILGFRIVKPRRIVFGPRGTHTIVERPLR